MQALIMGAYGSHDTCVRWLLTVVCARALMMGMMLMVLADDDGHDDCIDNGYDDDLSRWRC
jgi:hypothetical protein